MQSLPQVRPSNFCQLRGSRDSRSFGREWVKLTEMKGPFIVIRTSQAWQYLWAPSGSVIFLTLSLRAAGKRWKRPSPRDSLTFLREWTDVGQSAIYFKQETKVLLKRRVPCWVYWNSPVVYNVHCNPLARAILHLPSQGGRTSDLVSSPLEKTFRAPIACRIKSN